MLNRIILILLFSFSVSANLFISEAAEGSSNNKYIEIYNAGEFEADLSLYSLSSCSNGCDVDGEWDYPANVTFEAMLAPGDVYVVCHQSADETILAECDQTFTYLSNGDDLFALTDNSGLVVDMVGDYGPDPGSGWDVCGVSAATKDHTLVRKSSVTQGNFGDWGMSAGTDADDCEWIVLDQNTWDGVGFHEMDGNSSVTHVVEAGMFYYAPSTLTVEMGDTVVWDNLSGFHDVVAYDGSFALDACSAPCIIGEITFDTPGTYEYFCSVGNHEDQGMVGTIVVNGEIQLSCEDEAACNFMDEADCIYPEENYDCDGNCNVEIDECGECGGDGSSCAEAALSLIHI